MVVTDEQWVAMRHAAIRAALKVVNTDQQAEDCAHEALAELLVKPETLRNARSLEGLAATIAKRRAQDALRQREAVRRSILKLGALLPADVPDPSQGVVDRITAEAVTAALAELPDKTRAVLLRLAHGDSVKEAAAHLGLTTRAAENHLHRGRKRLQSVLSPLLGLAALIGASGRGLKHAAKPASVLAVPVAAALAVVISGPLSSGPTPPSFARPGTAVPGSTSATLTTSTSSQPSTTTTHPAAPAAADPSHFTSVVRTEPRKQHAALVDVSLGSQSIIVEPTQGRPDRGPVENAMTCLQNFQVTPYVIGCP